MTPRIAGVILPIFVIAAGLGLILLEPLTRARIVNGLLVSWGFPLLLMALVIGFCAFLLLAERAGTAILVGILSVGLLIGYGLWRDYQADLSYAATIEESDQTMPSFTERAPFLVAQRQATSQLSGINGDIGETDYLADDNRYTTLVDRRGPLHPGYAAVISQEIALTGQATGEPCRFDEGSDKRMNGLFGHSLTRAIAAKDSSLLAKHEDAWGYCDSDEPMIVVPVTRYEGWVVPIEVPAGVAVYSGDTGRVEIMEKVEAGDLPGPSVGISYAEKINASLTTRNGSWWSRAIGQSGLTDETKTDEDTNTGNHTNFSLARKGKDGSIYVSPFTSRAASQSIEAVTVLDSGSVEAGEPAKVSLYTMEQPRQSNAATADKIKADFASLPGWATGLTIQEIIPVSGDTWAASIGLNQNVTHRVLISADGSSCLHDAMGKKVRCSGEQEAPDVPGTRSVPDADVPDDIATLDDAKLAELQGIVTEEVLRRLVAK